MKRFRFDDLPLMVKVGFAPALALAMLALLSAGAVVLQQNQTHELERVVRTDMPNSLRMQKISERITGVHGQVIDYRYKNGATGTVRVSELKKIPRPVPPG